MIEYQPELKPEAPPTYLIDCASKGTADLPLTLSYPVYQSPTCPNPRKQKTGGAFGKSLGQKLGK